MKKLIFLLLFFLLSIGARVNALSINPDGTVDYNAGSHPPTEPKVYATTQFTLNISSGGSVYQVDFPASDVFSGDTIHIPGQSIAQKLEVKYGVSDGMDLLRTLMNNGATVTATPTIIIYWITDENKNPIPAIATITSYDQVDTIGLNEGFGETDRNDMKQRFSLGNIKINLPNEINLKADGFIGDTQYTTQSILLRLGVKVKNDSDDGNKAFPSVHFKITLTGGPNNINETFSGFANDTYCRPISSRNSKPNGEEFYFPVPSPMIAGNFNVTIEVNDTHNPEETKPDKARAYDDNFAGGVITIKDTPDIIGDVVKLVTKYNFIGFTDVNGNKMIKSGYGFEFDKDGIVEVDPGAYDVSYTSWIGDYQLDSVDISDVNLLDLKVTSPVKFIIGQGIKSDSISTTSNNFWWNWPSVTQLKTVRKNEPVFEFNFNPNTYSVNKRKALYIDTTTPDGVDYKISIGDGLQAKAHLTWKFVSGGTETLLSEPSNVKHTISVAKNDWVFVVKGSMFDDDSTTITR